MRAGFLVVAASALVACSGEPTDAPQRESGQPQPLVVQATSYPLAFFAERIGGGAVDVVFPVPAGVDPAHWSPDPEAIARAQAADLLLRHGAGDPAWLGLAILHRERVVDATASVRDRLIRRKAAQHQHGPQGDHSHVGLQPKAMAVPIKQLAVEELLEHACTSNGGIDLSTVQWQAEH